MAKDKDEKVSEESFNKQLLGMYNEFFNHGDNLKGYNNGIITLDKNSYNYMMGLLNLSKKGVKY